MKKGVGYTLQIVFRIILLKTRVLKNYRWVKVLPTPASSSHEEEFIALNTPAQPSNSADYNNPESFHIFIA
jgi:hypothetical protein